VRVLPEHAEQTPWHISLIHFWLVFHVLSLQVECSVKASIGLLLMRFRCSAKASVDLLSLRGGVAAT
jgi:hypothetical protein